jgi:putative ABC transport system permease protein
MTGGLYLAWRYLMHHRIKSAILVLAVALIVFLPGGLNVLVGQSAANLTARAEATPLLVGAKGSPLGLVLRALYFESSPPEPTSAAETLRVRESQLAEAIPLHVRFRVGDQPIVGTSLAYFRFRGLDIAAGRMIATLGECVLGAMAAERLGLAPGDHVVSSPENLFDLAGVYPLRMRVAGVLAPSHGPDDRAVFVDVKTAWVIEGLGHGHQELTDAAAEGAVLARDGQKITANASLKEYNEITPETAGSFHFHGDASGYPLTAVIVVPNDEKSQVILMGRYQSTGEQSQILRPAPAVESLLGTVFAVRSYVVAALALVGIATLAVTALVFMLSLRLRDREVQTLTRIGAARANVAVLLAAEIAFVLVVGAALAALLTFLTARTGAEAIRALLVS